MPREAKTIVYKFGELSDESQERARDWYRLQGLTNDWYDNTLDYAANIADIIGLDIRQRRVKLIDGTTRLEPSIYFSGFSNQGDGACFSGTYSHKRGAVAEIKKYAPLDAELHRIAAALQNAQRRHRYKLTARVTHSSCYNHEYSASIDVGCGDVAPDEETREEVREALRDYMRWIYSQLEREYEYLNSDEQVEESIKANEYEFYEDGTPV